MNKVMIIGGHGAVGREAATALARALPQAEIVLAGRNPPSMPMLPGTTSVRLDARDDDALVRALPGVTTVLMTAELDNARLARHCLSRGVHYLDVSANPRILTQIEDLDDLARSRDRTAVLSVGLVPGVTNLLARYCADRTPASSAHIGVLLGTGEKHGPAALRWTIDQVGELTGSWRMRFPSPHGVRTVHRFPFSDQYTLPATLSIPEVRTGMCLDTRFSTLALKLAQRPLVTRALRRPRVRAAVLAALSGTHFGSDAFAVTARVGQTQASLSGNRQSRATGLVAALLIQRIANLPRGARHIEQLVEPAEFLTELASHNFTLHIPAAPTNEGVRRP